MPEAESVELLKKRFDEQKMFYGKFTGTFTDKIFYTLRRVKENSAIELTLHLLEQDLKFEIPCDFAEQLKKQEMDEQEVIKRCIK